MSKHSPAPWRLNWGQVLDVNGLVVADLGHRTGEMEFSKDQVLAADARLIADSPELLEALKAAVAVIDDGAAGHRATSVPCLCERCDGLALIRRIEGEAKGETT